MKKPVDILYVEDDELDVDLVKTALDVVCESNQFEMDVAEDGERALRLLMGAGDGHAVRKPDLILLDLNLPGVHGLELLKIIKTSAELSKIPVVIFSTSAAPPDVDESYRLGACGYLVKPHELQAYRETFKALSAYWFQNVVLPSQS